MEEIKVGEYYKHFKGKNIYKILSTNVTYTGTNAKSELANLVIYQNIIDGKIFAREANELLEELDKERQIQYGQKCRIEKISLLDTICSLDKNIIFKIIPELKDCEGFDQKNPYHAYDVWEHTKVAMQKSKNDLDIKLALLLHDIGKPYTCQEENGVRHFKGHAQKSAEMAKEILKRLGYEENKAEDICYLIRNHATTIDVESLNKDNLEINKKLLYIQYCDASAYAPEYVEGTIKKLDAIKEKIKKKIEELGLNDNKNNEEER